MDPDTVLFLKTRILLSPLSLVGLTPAGFLAVLVFEPYLLTMDRLFWADLSFEVI